MKRNFVRIVSLLLVFILSLTLAGCGNTSTNESTDADGRRIVKWEVLKAGYGTVPYEKLAEAFMEKYPDILVKITFNPNINSTTAAKLETSNNLADVYSTNDLNGIKRWYSSGWIEPINDVYDMTLESGKKISESLTERANEACTYQDNAICIPEYTSVKGFVYNKTLFEKYGWSVPTNTNELSKLCKQILSDTNNTVAPIVYCGSAADGYLYFSNGWNYSYSGVANLDTFYSFESAEVFNPDNSKGKLYQLQNLKKFFFDEGNFTLAGSSGLTHIVAQSKLIQGECAMMMNGSWFENEMSSVLESNKDVELAMFPIPEVADSSGKVLHADGYTTEDNKQVIEAEYGSYYFIPSAASNKDDAKTFLKFLQEESSCQLYTANTNAIRPLSYSLDTTDAAYSEMTSFGKSIIEIANTCYLYCANPTSPIALKGLTGYWAKGSYPFNDIRDGVLTASSALEADYKYAKENWSKFESQVN